MVGSRKEGLFELRCEFSVESRNDEFFSATNRLRYHHQAASQVCSLAGENFFKKNGRRTGRGDCRRLVRPTMPGSSSERVVGEEQLRLDSRAEPHILSRSSRAQPYRHAPSAPSEQARGCALGVFPLGHEGAERRKALITTGHLVRRPRALAIEHARLPALHCGDFLHSHRTSSSDRRELPLTLSRRHLRRRSSDKSQPSKAAPSSGAGSDCASWDELAKLACRR